MRTTTLAALVGLAAPLTLLSPQALAWTSLDPSNPVWPTMPVTYRVNQSTIPGSIANIGVARVDQGFASWASPACTTWSTTNLGNTASSYNYQDGKNVVLWISNSWPGALGDVNSVIGVTLPATDQNNDLADADIVFNDVGFAWDEGGNGNNVDTLSIATHEEGHFLGLGHSGVNGATMGAFYPGGTSQASLAQDDKDGVCALYPVGGTAASSGSGGGDCQSCVDASVYNACSGSYDACGASQPCIDFYNCYAACQDQACVDACVNQYPQGAQVYSDLIDCVCADCAVECVQECGGSSSSSSTTSASASTTTAAATSGSGDTTATTGSGDTTGAGGAGATTGAGSGSGGSGGGKKKSRGDEDLQQVGACSVGAPSGGALGLLAAAAVGALVSRRRRRPR